MWSTTTVRYVRIDGTWIKTSAVEAVERTTSGRTAILLASGSQVRVGDIHGSISPDEAMKAITDQPQEES